jgi:hypothetical protein
MNHPTQEQWMEYLYDEIPPTQKKELESHLKGCAPCREKRAELQGTAETLDRWRVELPAKHELAPSWQPAAKWAVAAALLVTTAFATGRMSRPEVDLAALQAEISKPLEAKMQNEIQVVSARVWAAAQADLQAEFATQLQAVADKALVEANATTKEHLEQLALTLTALREEDKKSFVLTLEAFEQQRLSDLRSMREDIERVAVFSDQSYRSAQRQFVELASLNQAEENIQPEQN